VSIYALPVRNNWQPIYDELVSQADIPITCGYKPAWLIGPVKLSLLAA